VDPAAGDAGDDNIAFTVRDSAGTPHVWLYGHGGRSGGQLPNVRSSPIWLNTTEFFFVGGRPPARPTAARAGLAAERQDVHVRPGRVETASKISRVYSVAPAGQI
jgi:hypothetical protein